MSETTPVTKNLRDGVTTIYDGGDNSVEIADDEGNLQYTEPPHRPAVLVMDRGSRSHLRPGDEGVTEGSFTVQYREHVKQGSNPVAPREALAGVGAASAWASTNNDGGGVKTVGIKHTVASPTSGESDEIIDFGKCYDIELEFAEGDPNTLRVSFKHFGHPAITKAGAGSGTGSGSGSGA